MKVAPKINEVGVETLFGEDLISEKSLDEVILSYLAGEGEQSLARRQAPAASGRGAIVELGPQSLRR